jgi:hypothetical protein
MPTVCHYVRPNRKSVFDEKSVSRIVRSAIKAGTPEPKILMAVLNEMPDFGPRLCSAIAVIGEILGLLLSTTAMIQLIRVLGYLSAVIKSTSRSIRWAPLKALIGIRILAVALLLDAAIRILDKILRSQEALEAFVKVFNICNQVNKGVK